MIAFTDHAFGELGDSPDRKKLRQVILLDYDGSEICQIYVEKQILKVPLLALQVPVETDEKYVPLTLPPKPVVLIFCCKCGRPASTVIQNGTGLCHVHNPRNRPSVPAGLAKVGRNDPCPCGQFGLKFKKCCGNPLPKLVKQVPNKKPNGKQLGEHCESEVESDTCET